MFQRYPLRTYIHFFKLKLKEIFFPSDFISEKNINPDPIKQFDKWYKEAKKSRIPFYDAMTLSTSTTDGKVSGRMVLLKAFDEKGFVFFSNSTSRKGIELSVNPNASLTFFWNKKGKQVRIEGIVEIISDIDSDEYFATRPRGSQIAAWSSEQSSSIPNRNFLFAKIKQIEIKFKNKEIPRPDNWIGYRLIPTQIEFWQNRVSRLHDRFLFTVQNNKQWKYVRLSP